MDTPITYGRTDYTDFSNHKTSYTGNTLVKPVCTTRNTFYFVVLLMLLLKTRETSQTFMLKKSLNQASNIKTLLAWTICS